MVAGCVELDLRKCDSFVILVRRLVHGMYIYRLQTYATVLALISVSAKRTWAKLANAHLVLLLLATFLVFAYRDLWPLVTYTLQPADVYEGGLLWAKCVVLVLTAVVIPLVIPRQYVPFDPKACYGHHIIIPFSNEKSHTRLCPESCTRT